MVVGEDDDDDDDDDDGVAGFESAILLQNEVFTGHWPNQTKNQNRTFAGFNFVKRCVFVANLLFWARKILEKIILAILCCPFIATLT